jgi:hypothetical protein
MSDSTAGSVRITNNDYAIAAGFNVNTPVLFIELMLLTPLVVLTSLNDIFAPLRR